MMQVSVNRNEQPDSAYVVQRPQESDAIGAALRSAYTNHRMTVPAELRDALDRLDRHR